jgi:hypothetical protein
MKCKAEVTISGNDNKKIRLSTLEEFKPEEKLGVGHLF